MRKTISYGKAYKFVDHAAEHNPFANLEGTVLSAEALDMYFGEPNHMGFGVEGSIIKRLGWAIPIVGLTTYVVKLVHQGWHEYVSPNKTYLRRKLGSHNIIKIVEVK
nr:MAG TPA: hypothetical protein [Caudoviricetes sp.]